MASALASNHVFANRKDTMYFKTPGVVLASMGYVDMKDYEYFAAEVMEAVLVGLGVNQFEIHGASDNAGTDHTVIKAHALGTAPDAVGDTVVLECSAQELADTGANLSPAKKLRYVAVYLKCANAGDKCAVLYSLVKPKFPQDALTADVIS